MRHDFTEWVHFDKDTIPSCYVTDRKFFDCIRDSEILK